MNILILSASSKVLLVSAFQKAIRRVGGIVVAADITAESAAMQTADQAVIVPRSDHPDFSQAINTICDAFDIELIVPTRDGELPVMAALAPSLQARGVTVLVPPMESVAICCDTRRFVAYCNQIGVPTPRTYEPGVLPQAYPVFCRPSNRTINHPALRIEDEGALQAYLTLFGSVAGGVIVQEFVDAPEYSIDVLMDFNGRPVQAVARRRIATRAGESWKTKIEKIPQLTESALALSERLGLIGHNTLQAFFSPDLGIRFIEINARFGGASNLSIQAGLASPERMVQMAVGETAAATTPRPIGYGQLLLRHADDVIVPRDASEYCVSWSDLDDRAASGWMNTRETGAG
ncbi:MAG: ATP-grasp domain-containing protein [Alphaproteobacteria bacterium]